MNNKMSTTLDERAVISQLCHKQAYSTYTLAIDLIFFVQLLYSNAVILLVMWC